MQLHNFKWQLLKCTHPFHVYFRLPMLHNKKCSSHKHALFIKINTFMVIIQNNKQPVRLQTRDKGVLAIWSLHMEREFMLELQAHKYLKKLIKYNCHNWSHNCNFYTATKWEETYSSIQKECSYYKEMKSHQLQNSDIIYIYIWYNAINNWWISIN
jgi:hypothetical protein